MPPARRQEKREYVRAVCAEVQAEQGRIDDEPANRMRADYEDFQEWIASEGGVDPYGSLAAYAEAV